MPKSLDRPEDLPVGAVDAAGQPLTVAGVTLPDSPEVSGGEAERRGKGGQ